jgi:hypothetical protein
MIDGQFSSLFRNERANATIACLQMDKLHKDGLDWQAKAEEKFGEARQGASRYTTAASEQAAKARAAMDEAAAKARAKAQETFAPKADSSAAAAPRTEGTATPEPESDFVKASKAKFSGGSDADTDAATGTTARILPAWMQTLADNTRGFREGLRDASYDLFGAKPAQKSTIVRKLRPPPKPAAAATATAAGDAAAATENSAAADSDSATAAGTSGSSSSSSSSGDAAQGDSSSSSSSSSSSDTHQRDQEVLPGMVEAPEQTGALAIVKSAAEAWAALQEKLRQSVLIQVCVRYVCTICTATVTVTLVRIACMIV